MVPGGSVSAARRTASLHTESVCEEDGILNKASKTSCTRTCMWWGEVKLSIVASDLLTWSQNDKTLRVRACNSKFVTWFWQHTRFFYRFRIHIIFPWCRVASWTSKCLAAPLRSVQAALFTTEYITLTSTLELYICSDEWFAIHEQSGRVKGENIRWYCEIVQY